MIKIMNLKFLISIILIDYDDEKWMNSNSFELSCSSEKLLLFPGYLNKRTEDYSGLVWQPPKSV